jgi:hypothetical protein
MSHAFTRAPNLHQHTRYALLHTSHGSRCASPQAAQALPEGLWCVGNVEEHECLRALAAQAAEEIVITLRENKHEIIWQQTCLAANV